MSAAKARSIVWFRKGLRVHDNPALLDACRDAAHVFPIYVLDPYFVTSGQYRVGANRYNFLLESLRDLDASLRARGSRLIVLRGSPEREVAGAARRWRCDRLCFEADSEPYARERDARVSAAAAAAGCTEVASHVSHTLYDPAALAARAPGSRPPLTMQAFTRLVDSMGDPPPPAPDPPARLPPVDDSVAPSDAESRPPRSLREAGFPIPEPAADGMAAAMAAALGTGGGAGAGPSSPSLLLGLPPSPTGVGAAAAAAGGMPASDTASDGANNSDEDRLLAPASALFPGGETAALARLEAALADEAWVLGFDKPSTDPTAFEKPATTVLSPYLKFGCLSARLFHARLLEAYAKARRAGGTHTKPPTSLRGQLLWREFFYAVGSATPNFGRMRGNPVCRQIDWDADPARLAAWREGRTGFPWIDAAMRQLRDWGWMHHLARHAVACFLTRGDLYQSWEAGAAVFEERLLDADHFVNSANWMWLSASAFFSQYYRVYSPVTFAKKYDPEGKFVRRFVPELAAMPQKYVYEPWTAPLEVQRKAGCIIGRDYPFPMVDHTAACKVNMGRMKAAYAAGGAAAAGGGGGGASAAGGAGAGDKRAASPDEGAAAAGGGGAPPAADKKKAKDAAAGKAGKKQRTISSMLQPPPAAAE